MQSTDPNAATYGLPASMRIAIAARDPAAIETYVGPLACLEYLIFGTPTDHASLSADRSLLTICCSVNLLFFIDWATTQWPNNP